MAEATDSSSFSFVEMEHDVLDFWQRSDAFAKSLGNTKEKKPYIFYDGPPFATGLPHHGHLVASTIKDIVPRYWTMKGHYVIRRFGWDCHGLPIEHEIDKQLGMSSQEAVAKLGVAGYNDECRSIVQRYVSEWRQTITRLGRWVDFDDDYKTMDAWYMESVWWVFKQLWDKGLVFQGSKVMAISTALATPLSIAEAGMNYMDVQDPAVTVLLRIKDSDEHLAVWTTTPWTLPSNLAVCVGDDIDYVLVRDDERDVSFWLAEARREQYADLPVLKNAKGSELTGLRYEPLFPYFAEEDARGAFVVVSDDYVTTESGTGLVHQAPAFGEDDFRIARENGIEAFVCPVGLDGVFTDAVPDFAGQYVKAADKNIIRALKESGALYRSETIDHSYPFCYRSDTPLIYRAIPSWFVRVSGMRDKLAQSNEKIHWVPDHIKDGRFGNWIGDAQDWAVSRNRYWGTPLPIWVNDVTGNAECVGSIDELAERTGVRIDDLHREHVDELTFTIAGEDGTYRRVPEVLDCWFESGSMPYAQLHYPFENEDVFNAGFPAEFVAEGLDQTRGWFYTLTVLAAALFDKPAFRNVIVNGMVLASDGKKMSKRLRNYTPPDELMEAYGADALRLYLITSGLVRGEEQRFTDDGVRDMTRRALLPWYNAFSFLKTYAQIDGWTPDHGLHYGSNVLDRWILSRLQSLKAAIAKEMGEYRLYNVVPRLFGFIEELTNWYIRLNRSRFWGEEITADKIAAYSTLYTAITELSQAMAPFAPFLSEHLYRQLAALSGQEPKPVSIHLCEYPESEDSLVRPDLEAAVTQMQDVILLGRRKREEEKIGLRTPLASLTIVHRDAALLEEMRALEGYLMGELNVKSVRYDSNEDEYVERVAKPNFPLLGKRLGKQMKAFAGAIKNLDRSAIDTLQSTGEVQINGEVFSAQEIEVLQAPKEGSGAVSNRQVSVVLDCELTDALLSEGLAREAVNRIQRARKDAGFDVSDRISVVFDGDAAVVAAVLSHREYVSGEVLATSFESGDANDGIAVEIDGKPVRFKLAKAPS
ncbi:MAG: isoleucine--tRNA ligase [Pseudomonadaceae bacterium]|nr:isoleucine--tRNA ligase [Pseudomonadaceae bacterium]